MTLDIHATPRAHVEHRWVKICLGEHDEVIPRERRRLHNIPRIMVWAAVGIGFKSGVVMFPQKTAGGETSFCLNANGYVRRCLNPIVAKVSAQRRIFQQDGARPHQNNHVRDYLRKKDVMYIEDWPPYSPDLNMIEYVWPLLNARISELQPVTMQELKAAIPKAWANIPQQEIDAVCKGFRNKLNEVLRNNGRCC